MKQLNEKVAIVTGAGQGIGKGIALCLAKRGVKVIATGRRAEPIEQTIAILAAIYLLITRVGRKGRAKLSSEEAELRARYKQEHNKK